MTRPSHRPSARYVPSPTSGQTRYRRQAPPRGVLRRVDPLAWFAIASLVVGGGVFWWMDGTAWIIAVVAAALAALILALEITVFGRPASRPAVVVTQGGYQRS